MNSESADFKYGTASLEQDLPANDKIADMKRAIYNKVKYHLEKEKVYLDPKLSLVRFSSIVGTNTTYLSGTINSCFGCNLKTLVNRFRIEHAKRLLLDEQEYDIKEIPRMCGFASRSAFYSSFQRVENTTPLDYLAKNKPYQKQ